MTAPLGDAFITAHADTSHLAPEMTEGTKKAAEEAEVASRDDFVEAGDKMGKTTGDEFGKSFVRDAAGRLRDAKTGRFATEADKLGKEVGDKIGNSAGDETESALKKKVSKLGTLLLPDWIKTIGIWVAGIAPAALQLAAALAPAAGILAAIIPIGIGAAASAGILKLAFMGVSQAIKDAGVNAKAYQKDLAKLTPGAQLFVEAIAKLKPELKVLQQNAQASFFGSGWIPLIPKLAKSLPELGKVIGDLGGSLGGLVRQFLTLFTQKGELQLFFNILENFSTVVGIAGNALAPLVDALLRIGEAASGQLLITLTKSFVSLSQSFDTFIKGADKSGDLQRFFSLTLMALHQIWIIGGDALSIVASLLDAAGQAGGGGPIIGFLTTLAGVLATLDNNGTLAAVFKVFNQVVSVVASAVKPLIGPLSTLLLLVAQALSGDLTKLTPALINLVTYGLLPLINDMILGLPYVNKFVVWIIELLDWASTHGHAVELLFSAIGTYIVLIKTWNAAESFAKVVKGTKAWTLAQGDLDVALDANPIGAFILAITIMAAEIAFMVYTLDQLQKKTGVFTTVGAWFDTMWHKVENFTSKAGADLAKWYNDTVGFFESLPGKLSGAYTDIKKWLDRAWGAVTTFFEVTIPMEWDKFESWLESLPGKIAAKIQLAVDAAFQTLGIGVGIALFAILKGPQAFLDTLTAVVVYTVSEMGKLPGAVIGGITSTAITVVPLIQKYIVTPTIALFAAMFDRTYALAISWGTEMYNQFMDVGKWMYQNVIVGGTEKVYDGFVVFGERSLSLFTTVFHKINSVVRTNIEDLNSFIRGFPGNLEGLGPKMYAAGLKLIQELFRGLAAPGLYIDTIASRIVDHVKTSLNNAIGQINTGIDRIGKHIPGGLPHIPMLAAGAFITRPTLALIGERNPEVVLPTDNPGRAAQLLNQSGLANQLAGMIGSPAWNVIVKIGDRDITDIVDTQVSRSNAATATALAFGPRGS